MIIKIIGDLEAQCNKMTQKFKFRNLSNTVNTLQLPDSLQVSPGVSDLERIAQVGEVVNSVVNDFPSGFLIPDSYCINAISFNKPVNHNRRIEGYPNKHVEKPGIVAIGLGYLGRLYKINIPSPSTCQLEPDLFRFEHNGIIYELQFDPIKEDRCKSRDQGTMIRFSYESNQPQIIIVQSKFSNITYRDAIEYNGLQRVIQVAQKTIDNFPKGMQIPCSYVIRTLHFGDKKDEPIAQICPEKISEVNLMLDHTTPAGHRAITLPSTITDVLIEPNKVMFRDNDVTYRIGII